MEKTHEAQESSGNFKRTMKARHLIMLSLGGVIGTGLFYNTGGLIATAGPFGTLLAYAAGALMIYAIMQSLGELSVAMPVTGSIHTFASKFISPGTGFVMALLYMLTWCVPSIRIPHFRQQKGPLGWGFLTLLKMGGAEAPGLIFLGEGRSPSPSRFRAAASRPNRPVGASRRYACAVQR